ncbi:hypothetical protein LZ554_005221 [Drepanopeziza brunnea f. sp. 'monogermtubi']|nr:hypothetical protein LZ554_005221 [Drepanopeziza brunnea f. sp. 'monogermtubi']
MQFKTSTIAAFLLLAAPSLGFLVPERAPDGVYVVQLDTSGQEVRTRQGDILSEAVTVARGSHGGSMKRDGLDELGCFKDQDKLNESNTKTASAGLQEEIGAGGKGLGSHQGIYSISGMVAAYCCNNRAAGNTCYQEYQSQANEGITGVCGSYEPGFAYDRGAHITYGYQHRNYDFCPQN